MNISNLKKILNQKNKLKPHLSSELASFDQGYIAALNSMARTNYETIYAINYATNSFEYVAGNGFALCGRSAEEVKELGFEFYFQVIHPDELDTFNKVVELGFNFINDVPIEDRLEYSLSFDFRIAVSKNRYMIANHKFTPLLLTPDGKMWKALCVVSYARKKNKECVIIRKQYSNIHWSYDLDNRIWRESKQQMLSERECEIIRLSMQGLNTNEIAETCCITIDTVKYHRQKMYTRFELTCMSELIPYVLENHLL